MSEFVSLQTPVAEDVEHARALQLRLYREIGVSAVATALEISLETPVESNSINCAVSSATDREHQKAA